MPITFTCKCGKNLRTGDEHAGKRLKCPACGRALVVPAPAAEELPESDWELDASPVAAARAEQAGVARRGRASVVRLHAAGSLDNDLAITGSVTCRNCRTTSALRGKVFGRVGLGGTLATVTCTQCRARIWVGFSSHAAEDGTDVFLFAPTLARDFNVSENQALPSPELRINPVTHVARRLAAAADDDAYDPMLASLLKAIRRGQMYQEVCVLAQHVVSEPMSPARTERVCMALRELLDKEQKTYLMSILTEALACLRDEAAVQPVRDALRRALAAEEVGDKANAPLQELCLLALLFGDRSGFLEAVGRGLPKLSEPTRARRLGKKLALKEIIPLVRDGDTIDAYESVLAGPDWHDIRPVLTSAVEEEAATPKAFLSRLFGPKKPGSSTTHAVLPAQSKTADASGDESKAALTAALSEHFPKGRVDLLWLNMKDERGAKYDYQRPLAEARRHWAGHGVMVVRGSLVETMATSPFVGLVCRHEEYTTTRHWFGLCSQSLWNCSDKEVLEVQKQEPGAIELVNGTYLVSEFQWVE